MLVYNSIYPYRQQYEYQGAASYSIIGSNACISPVAGEIALYDVDPREIYDCNTKYVYATESKFIELLTKDSKNLKIALKDAGLALFLYRKTGSSKFRKLALKQPQIALTIACEIDHKPANDTRNAVLADPEYAAYYARYVDKCPRDDTRTAACADPQTAVLYARYVDRCFDPETASAVMGDINAVIKYYKKVLKIGEVLSDVGYEEAYAELKKALGRCV